MTRRTGEQAGPGLDDQLAAARDEQIAREEISAYYAEQFAKARQAFEAAVTRQAEAEQALAAWEQRGEITFTSRDACISEKLAAELRRVDLVMITNHSMSRYMLAAKSAIERPGDAELHAAALAAQERERALRRWLTAQGYDLGLDAAPAGRGRGR